MKKSFFITVFLLSVNLSWAQWEPDVRLTNASGTSYPANNSSRVIAACGDTLHLVWKDMRDGNGEIYYKRSVDGGSAWGTDVRLTNNSALSMDPCVVVSGSVVHVAWEDNRDGNREIYYKRSEDGGATWGTDTRLTNFIRASESPCMAISGSVLHIAWYDERDDPSGNWFTEIYYKRSEDGGITWGPDVRLTNKAAYAGFPCIAVSGATVHIVWEDERSGSGDVYYIRSTDGGLTWEADTRLTNDPANQYDPAIDVSGSAVHVVWQDDRNGFNNDEIYHKRSTDGGATWDQDTRLTVATGLSHYATVAVSGSKVHVVWYDDRTADNEIYYKRSQDAGETWGADLRLTNAPGKSLMPFIALSGSEVHIVWTDNRDGNDEIYYKRNPTGNVSVGLEDESKISTDPGFRMYPNPASTTVHIGLNYFSGGTTLLSIRNVFGEVVLNRRIQQDETGIDVSGLQNGLYYAGIEGDNHRYFFNKLIILK